MNIPCNLLPKQKKRKLNLNVCVDVYPLAEELFNELSRVGVIDRIKRIPQLGVIKVSSKLSKSRYDYILLQLYLHQLIKKNLQANLHYTYNNLVKSKDFRNDYNYPSSEMKLSIGDILQILTIVYNVGHFFNTFTASRSAVLLASKNDSFRNLILNATAEKRFKEVAETFVNERNYRRFHLYNSLLLLERCNQNLSSVAIAKEILFAYINESSYSLDCKLHYIFSIFKNVRNVSYMAYDLQIAHVPLVIDLCDEKALLVLLGELLSEYNNNQSTRRLVDSIGKMLDDSVYNENSNAICYYKISKRIESEVSKDNPYLAKDYYLDYFIKKTSAFNKEYSHKRDYTQHHILKLTFPPEERAFSEGLFNDLERINNTRVGYYDRHSGEQTILVSMKKI